MDHFHRQGKVVMCGAELQISAATIERHGSVVAALPVLQVQEAVTGVDAVRTRVQGAGKREGVHDVFACHPDILENNDYIRLPDDDLEIKPQAVDMSLCAVREHDPWHAQVDRLRN